MYGASYRVKADITVADLEERTQQVIGREVDVIRDQLARNRIELVDGTARFADPHTSRVEETAARSGGSAPSAS